MLPPIEISCEENAAEYRVRMSNYAIFQPLLVLTEVPYLSIAVSMLARFCLVSLEGTAQMVSLFSFLI